MMCAFMTPIIKDDWQLYPSHVKRSRKGSENSQNSNVIPRNKSLDLRRKCLGEKRSLSYHDGPTRNKSDLSFIKSEPRSYHLSIKNSRSSSRSSSLNHVSTESPTSPNGNSSSSRKKSQSSTSLNKFHNRVMDKLKNVFHIKDNEKHNDDDNNANIEKS